jgi:hypothetical protein
MEVQCLTCHPKAQTSEKPIDELYPGHNECQECHEIDNNCSTCHVGEPRKIERIPLYISYFSHKRHLDFSCVNCHSRIQEETKFLTKRKEAFPKMELCVVCHRENNVKKDCNGCHTDKEEKLLSFHPFKYRNTHSEDGRFFNENCLMCHDKQFDNYIGGITIPSCNSCHAEQNIVFKNHPENFKFNHSFSYLSGEKVCNTCHVGFKDCVDCHHKEHIYPPEHNSIDWVDRNDGGEHSERAKIEPERCIVCHEEEDNVCKTCHGGGK